MKSPQSKSIRLLQDKYQENLEVMLKNLLKDETLSDITLHCRDGSVRAHRVILAASSPYFKKIFEEHPENQVAFVLYGVAAKQIRSMVELIYRGSTQIPCDMTTKLCDICEEFGMKGIVDENDKHLLSPTGRDTRFRGTKRVTVDFENDSVNPARTGSPKVIKYGGERRASVGSEKSFKRSTENLPTNSSPSHLSPTPPTNPLDSLGLIPTKIKEEPTSPSCSASTATYVNTGTSALSPEARRRHNWALKQRKYKCTLCPASFKRASHLSRHQLVHTGERPYACTQCDKAFSRHDKLKHHIRKAHPVEYIGNMMETSTESESYTIGNVKMDSSQYDSFGESTHITREDLLARMKPKTTEEPDKEANVSKFPASTATPKPLVIRKPRLMTMTTPEITSDSSPACSSGGIPLKKGRGRPRKYPPVPKPLIKRPRGRPRLNQSPVVPSPFGLYKPDTSDKEPGQYALSNIPFDALQYLTKSIHIETESPENYEDPNSSMEEGHFMEPLVEIQMDQETPKHREQDEEPVRIKQKSAPLSPVASSPAGNFLKNIGLLENSALSKVDIGECTVSVSQGPSVT